MVSGDFEPTSAGRPEVAAVVGEAVTACVIIRGVKPTGDDGDVIAHGYAMTSDRVDAWQARFVEAGSDQNGTALLGAALFEGGYPDTFARVPADRAREFSVGTVHSAADPLFEPRFTVAGLGIRGLERNRRWRETLVATTRLR